MLKLPVRVLAAGMATALCLTPLGAAAQSKGKKVLPAQPVPPPPDYATQAPMLPPAARQAPAFDAAEITKIPSEKQKYCRKQNNCSMTGPCPPCAGQ